MLINDSNLKVNIREIDYKIGTAQDMVLVELGENLDDIVTCENATKSEKKEIMKQMIRKISVEMVGL